MGKEIVVAELPKCDFCKVREARYDGKTARGPWAFMCEDDWQKYGVGKLGTGQGQHLALEGETRMQKDRADIASVRGLREDEARAALADLGIEGEEADRELEDWGF